jgi:uncharacterized protein YegP (UPF0339 family)
VGEFEMYKDSAGQFRWRLRAPNGEIIAQGEGYASKQGCQSGIDAVKKYAPGAPVSDQT